MMPSSSARILVMAALAIAAVAGVDATPETTCRAAASADRRVDYGFCVSRLSQHHDSPDADTWGLAKVAADVGVLIAGNGVYDIKHMLAGSKARAARGGRARAPLERCEALYSRMRSAFAEAYDGIDRRDYAAGKASALEAASLARRCADALARAGVAPSPLAKQGADSVRMAIVCTAITSLIK